MPIIKVHILEGRTLDQRRKLAKGFTDVCVNELGVKPDAVRVIFAEMKKDEYAVSGELAIDKK